MSTTNDNPSFRHRGRGFLYIVALLAAVAGAGSTALLVSIFERKQEAKNPFYRVVELTDSTEDPAIWGKNFPMQYDAYMRTVDQVRTRYGGSEAVPRTPSEADPRSIVAQSRLEEDPRLRIMWAGYAFAVDFREERGHAHMLQDQTFTERQRVISQPGTCMHCHASVYVPYMRLGDGNLVAGFERMNQMKYPEARKLVRHPVACIDCHAPDTMQLRVTRPGFLEGIRALKASEGVPEYDVNRMASRQEMRTFVCGQCHVEYYFRGPEKRLVYPWSKGLKVDQILAYYDEAGFKDWTHAETGADMLKAQHPEFEMWNQGIHARSGVACADCHMPYSRTGGLKISDHHVRSPLLNVNHACQTCHKWSEAEMRARAEADQERTFRLRDRAMNALVALIEDIRQARAAGKAEDGLKAARDFQRKAQFRLDFVEAENSMGFHAPGEAARVLAESIDFSRQGQLSLR
jgi:nitrite reductase (cytochrome c-552)